MDILSPHFGHRPYNAKPEGVMSLNCKILSIRSLHLGQLSISIIGILFNIFILQRIYFYRHLMIYGIGATQIYAIFHPSFLFKNALLRHVKIFFDVE